MERREGGREMDHVASECVMVGRVGGRVKQMSRAGDDICLLLVFFVCVFCYFSPKTKVDLVKVAESHRKFPSKPADA